MSRKAEVEEALRLHDVAIVRLRKAAEACDSAAMDSHKQSIAELLEDCEALLQESRKQYYAKYGELAWAAALPDSAKP